MEHGEFSGEAEAVWLTEEGSVDRRMRLLRDFFYTDPSMKRWSGPQGSLVDGASIPRALWTIVGSPYTGDYRRASIVHDIACDEAGGDQAKRRAADRMFYHACRAGGCSIWQSILLYLGVRIGALVTNVPKWYATAELESTGPRLVRTAEELRLERDFQALAQSVLGLGETDDPRVLEQRADDALRALAGPHSVPSVDSDA